MIKAIIFDMDGLLIDSEPFWEEAETQVFTALGVPLTREMKRETTGLRADEVVQYWQARYPWKKPTQKEVVATVVTRVAELVREKGLPRAGVKSVIELCEAANLPMAIASSSHTLIIDAVLDKLSLSRYMQVVHSAEHEKYGKPHPGVYITTARKLGVAPVNCLAFEDSPNGVLAAKAARMTCIAVPDKDLQHDKVFCIADRILDSLIDFRLDMVSTA